MKSILPLFSSLIFFASCSTAYQSGQTPDDVYFSPARPQQEYVQTERNDDRNYRRSEEVDRNEDDYYSYNDDRYLRMKIRNRSQWSYLDDYYRDPYAFNYYNKYSNNYYYNGYGYSNPRSYWNSYYNPYANSYNPYYNSYGGHVIVVNPRTPVRNTPRTYNLHVFDNPQNSNANNNVQGNKAKRYNSNSNRTNRDYTPPRSTGDDLRNTMRSSENSSPSRPPANTQSSSGNSSSSGGTAPKRKF